MRATSEQAYNELKDVGKLGRRQEELYQCIRNNPDHTDMELCRILGFNDANKVRPRRKELYDLRLIKEGQPRLCSETGRWSNTWRPGIPPPPAACATGREMQHVYNKLHKMNSWQRQKLKRLIEEKEGKHEQGCY